jgi:hypothetical protein
MSNAIDLTSLARVKAWLQSAVLPSWTKNTVYTLSPPSQINDASSGGTGHLQTVVGITGNGQSGGTAPTWNENGGQTTDGNVTWQDGGLCEDEMIQDCITAASLFFLWRTGRLPSNGDVPAASPLVAPQAYTEWYDGNGSNQLFLRQTPIQSVSSLTINGNTITQSASLNQAGWVIAPDGKSLRLRSGAGIGGPNFYNTTMAWGLWGGSAGLSFQKGVLNIEVVYQAGFTSTPYDLELACRRVVAKNYKTRQWIGQKSQALAQGAGTVSYRDFDIEPEDEKIIVNYTQLALA